jgi:hypothetical protein
MEHNLPTPGVVGHKQAGPSTDKREHDAISNQQGRSLNPGYELAGDHVNAESKKKQKQRKITPPTEKQTQKRPPHPVTMPDQDRPDHTDTKVRRVQPCTCDGDNSQQPNQPTAPSAKHRTMGQCRRSLHAHSAAAVIGFRVVLQNT